MMVALLAMTQYPSEDVGYAGPPRRQ